MSGTTVTKEQQFRNELARNKSLNPTNFSWQVSVQPNPNSLLDLEDAYTVAKDIIEETTTLCFDQDMLSTLVVSNGAQQTYQIPLYEHQTHESGQSRIDAVPSQTLVGYLELSAAKKPHHDGQPHLVQGNIVIWENIISQKFIPQHAASLAAKLAQAKQEDQTNKRQSKSTRKSHQKGVEKQHEAHLRKHTSSKKKTHRATVTVMRQLESLQNKIDTLTNLLQPGKSRIKIHGAVKTAIQNLNLAIQEIKALKANKITAEGLRQSEIVTKINNLIPKLSKLNTKFGDNDFPLVRQLSQDLGHLLNRFNWILSPPKAQQPEYISGLRRHSVQKFSQLPPSVETAGKFSRIFDGYNLNGKNPIGNVFARSAKRIETTGFNGVINSLLDIYQYTKVPAEAVDLTIAGKNTSKSNRLRVLTGYIVSQIAGGKEPEFFAIESLLVKLHTDLQFALIGNNPEDKDFTDLLKAETDSNWPIDVLIKMLQLIANPKADISEGISKTTNKKIRSLADKYTPKLKEFLAESFILAATNLQNQAILQPSQEIMATPSFKPLQKLLQNENLKQLISTHENYKTQATEPVFLTLGLGTNKRSSTRIGNWFRNLLFKAKSAQASQPTPGFWSRIKARFSKWWNEKTVPKATTVSNSPSLSNSRNTSPADDKDATNLNSASTSPEHNVVSVTSSSVTSSQSANPAVSPAETSRANESESQNSSSDPTSSDEDEKNTSTSNPSTPARSHSPTLSSSYVNMIGGALTLAPRRSSTSSTISTSSDDSSDDMSIPSSAASSMLLSPPSNHTNVSQKLSLVLPSPASSSKPMSLTSSRVSTPGTTTPLPSSVGGSDNNGMDFSASPLPSAYSERYFPSPISGTSVKKDPVCQRLFVDATDDAAPAAVVQQPAPRVTTPALTASP